MQFINNKPIVPNHEQSGVVYVYLNPKPTPVEVKQDDVPAPVAEPVAVSQGTVAVEVSVVPSDASPSEPVAESANVVVSAPTTERQSKYLSAFELVKTSRS